VVEDVCMPSLYNDEGSSLSIAKALFEFPWRMALSLARRLLLKNFIYDFTMESVYILAGIPMLLTGVTYGGVSWVTYASKGVPAPTGTVVIPAMLIILGFQLLLAAVNLDLASVPQQPLTAPLALGDPPRAPADPLRRGGTEETPANGGAELGTTRKGGNGVD